MKDEMMTGAGPAQGAAATPRPGRRWRRRQPLLPIAIDEVYFIVALKRLRHADIGPRVGRNVGWFARTIARAEKYGGLKRALAARLAVGIGAQMKDILVESESADGADGADGGYDRCEVCGGNHD